MCLLAQRKDLDKYANLELLSGKKEISITKNCFFQWKFNFTLVIWLLCLSLSPTGYVKSCLFCVCCLWISFWILDFKTGSWNLWVIKKPLLKLLFILSCCIMCSQSPLTTLLFANKWAACIDANTNVLKKLWQYRHLSFCVNVGTAFYNTMK